MTYSEKLKDPRWQRKRLEILNRDNFTCCDCEATTDTLHVHHCHYSNGDPWDTPSELLLTLCEPCHKARGKLEPQAKLLFAKLLAKLHHAYVAYGVPELIADLEKVCATPNDQFGGPSISEGSEAEWESDQRWYVYACNHPEARPFYDAVTGRQFPWRKLDEDVAAAK